MKCHFKSLLIIGESTYILRGKFSPGIGLEFSSCVSMLTTVPLSQILIPGAREKRRIVQLLGQCNGQNATEIELQFDIQVLVQQEFFSSNDNSHQSNIFFFLKVGTIIDSFKTWRQLSKTIPNMLIRLAQIYNICIINKSIFYDK